MCLGQGQNAKSQYTFWFLSHCDTITLHMSDSNSSTDPASALATLLTEARYKPSERIDELSTTEMLQVMNAAALAKWPMPWLARSRRLRER